MSENKFKTYLKKGQPFGDIVDRPFVNDAVGDLNLPDPKSWDELEAYLKDRDLAEGDLKDVLKAAEYIWKLYVDDTRSQTV